MDPTTPAVPPARPVAAGSGIGILLINLGTPEAPDPKAVRRYLGEFLSDRRVVELPPLLWQPILRGIVLPLRSRKSATKYAQIWMTEGSPLRVHTERQAKLLQGLLGERGKPAPRVAYAMRYGSPSVADTLEKLLQEGRRNILVLPLYPQYAGSTTGSAGDAVFHALAGRRRLPGLRIAGPYHDHPRYIAALAASVRRYQEQNGRGEVLVMSFHGLPEAAVRRGDPYREQCETTAALLAQALGLAASEYRIAYQSRFGAARWLSPHTDASLRKLAEQGIARVDVVCPGFAGDCLETLEEIALEGKATFMTAGGKEFGYIPCLNENPEWIEALYHICLDNLGGWS